MKNKEKYADLIKTISTPCIIEEYYSGENCKEYEGFLDLLWKILEMAGRRSKSRKETIQCQ